MHKTDERLRQQNLKLGHCRCSAEITSARLTGLLWMSSSFSMFLVTRWGLAGDTIDGCAGCFPKPTPRGRERRFD